MFLDDLRASKDLFAKIERGQRLTAEDRNGWDELKDKYGLSAEGTCRTQEALAECLGKARQTIVRWKKEGMPIEPDGTYDPLKVARWAALTHPDTDKLFGTDTGAAGAADPDQAEINWESEFRKFRAKLAELEYHKALGELIARAEVEKLLTDRAVEFRRALLDRGRRLALKLAGKDSATIQAMLEEDALDLLRIYTRPHQLGQPAAADMPEEVMS